MMKIGNLIRSLGSLLIAVSLTLGPNACARRAVVLAPHPPHLPGPWPEEDLMRKGGLVIAYEGQDGRSVLELLKARAQVLTSTYLSGELVETINGIGKHDNNGYSLIFYVNGAEAEIGAGDYITKKGDKIEWKLLEPRKNQ